MNRNIAKFTNIEKSFPIKGSILKKNIDQIHVLNGINLEVEAEKITGIIGESGCGKSTLAKLLLKLEYPSSGNIEFQGTDLFDVENKKKEYYRNVQMIFQDPYSSLNPRLKVKDIVGEMVRIRNVSKAEEQRRVIDVLGDVGLGKDILQRYPHEFSGGQRQRIAIARALIVRPKLLVADEPVSALDLSLRLKTLSLIQRLKMKYNLTVVLISHDLHTASDFCDNVAVMYLGRIVEFVSGKKLFKNALHPYLRALIATMPVLDPRKRDTEKKVIRGEVPDLTDIPKGCAFHTRCVKKIPICERIIPNIELIEKEHFAACHLYKKLDS